MTRISCTPKTGPFAGLEVFTNREGEGIFTRLKDGTNQQHTGTGQTPTFRSSQQLASYLRRHYSTFENPSPGTREHGEHATVSQRINAAKALKKAREFYDSDDLVTVPRALKNYKAPEAFVDLGGMIALEYDCDKFDGKPRIYRHESEKKRSVLMSVDGSTFIVYPPFKLTKRGIEG